MEIKQSGRTERNAFAGRGKWEGDWRKAISDEASQNQDG